MSRYYSKLRPISIGTFPKPIGNKITDMVNFDERTEIDGIGMAWGYIEYEQDLSKEDADKYELVKLYTTFIEFLKATDWYDGELLIDGLESEFSFVWDGDNEFTEEGYEKFKGILNGSFRACEDYLEVTTDGVDEELIDLFHATIAGYVSESKYNSWIKEN